MRRYEREVTDINSIYSILNDCNVCRIAMTDNDSIYIVPLNYGYTSEDDKIRLWFHSAEYGRKVNAMRANPRVAFEMDCSSFISAETACSCTSHYRSIIGEGRVTIVDKYDINTKMHGLSAIVRHLAGKDMPIPQQSAENVNVFYIDVDIISAKINE